MEINHHLLLALFALRQGLIDHERFLAAWPSFTGQPDTSLATEDARIKLEKLYPVIEWLKDKPGSQPEKGSGKLSGEQK